MITKHLLPCLVCPLAKQTRSPFPSSIHILLLVLILYIVIYGDLIPFIAHDGGKFFHTIVDDYSHCTWVYMSKSKSDARPYIQSFCNLVETQFNTLIKVLCSDNGLEFSMTEFYSAYGIIHQRSCIETPTKCFIQTQTSPSPPSCSCSPFSILYSPSFLVQLHTHCYLFDQLHSHSTSPQKNSIRNPFS